MESPPAPQPRPPSLPPPPPVGPGAAAAVAAVRSGQRVFVHGGAAVPRALLAALVARAGELRDVELVHLHTLGPAPTAAPELAGSFRHLALFVGANVREAVQAGRADFVPVFLSDIPDLFRSGRLPLDVALLNVSPPDAHGFCSLGTSVDVAKAAAESARLVIAQLNPAVPRSLGDSFVPAGRFHATVAVDEPPPEETPPPPGAAEAAIGAHVAGLVEDGATLQLGIGAIPNAVLAALRGHRDLGVHTEMFSDGVVELVEAGVVTGARKPVHPGKVVASFVVGTRRTYAFVHDNPRVELHPCDYTNDTALIRRHPAMTAINSALQVDLTGQVCANSLGPPRLQRGGRADGLHARGRPGRAGEAHHRPPRHGPGRDGLAPRPHPHRRRRRDHHPGPRALRGHRVRRGRPARQEPPRARPGPRRPGRPPFREELERAARDLSLA